MDYEKLKLIKEDILKEPLILKSDSNEFCGLYVDGTGELTFELADASFHAFKVYSEYNYPVYLFISLENDKDEIEKIVKKYSDTKVYSVAPLKTALLYNEWFFNCPWFYIDPKYERVCTFQVDGAVISKGWESYFVNGDWDFIGASWRSDIKALAYNHELKTLKVANGGMSCRKIKSMIKVVQFVNKYGGQHKFFKGVQIDGIVKQDNSWLAEDLMACSVGFTFDLFKPLTEEESKKFGHEPIELSLYMNKSSPLRPMSFHKIDN